MSKPTVFIGCSVEGLNIANEVHTHLQDCSDPTIWKDGVFGLGGGTLEALVGASQSFDFAILILTPDAVAIARHIERNLPRDNVLFELGLFMGALGRERALILCSETKPPDLPSDLAGVTIATYKERHDGSLSASLAPACQLFRKRILSLGIHPRSTFRDQRTTQAWQDLSKSVHGGLEVGHDAFSDEVRADVQTWNHQSGIWLERRLHSVANYSNCLISVYRHAKRNIFSTSVPRYLQAWHSQWGSDVLRIQRENRHAASTRVFIFHTREELTKDAIAIMQNHRSHRVDVWMHFAGDKLDSIFPEEHGPDWTIVDDGEIVGITRQFGSEYEADWYFGHETEGARFRQYKANLLKGSERYCG